MGAHQDWASRITLEPSITAGNEPVGGRDTFGCQAWFDRSRTDAAAAGPWPGGRAVAGLFNAPGYKPQANCEVSARLFKNERWLAAYTRRVENRPATALSPGHGPAAAASIRLHRTMPAVEGIPTADRFVPSCYRRLSVIREPNPDVRPSQIALSRRSLCKQQS